MLKKPNNKQKTVAEKVAEAIIQYNENNSESDSADEATGAKVVEYDVDQYELPQAETTEFRKRNIKFLSDQNEKYKGRLASRNDFESDDSVNEEDAASTDSSENEKALEMFNNQKQQTEVVDSEQEFRDDEEDLADDYSGESELDSDDESEDNEVISKVNHEAELQKGLCVQNQLRIWERLLELRINLQKLLNKTNRLPPPQELKDLENNNSKYRDIKETTCKQSCLLLQNLLTLKNDLTSQYPEMKNVAKSSLKRPLPFKDFNFEEPAFKRVSQYLDDGFKQFRNYRNDVLVKWDDRTKLLQPGAGSKQKTFNEEYDIIKKIDNALINKSLMIEKSQRLQHTVPNDLTQQNVINANMYDDSDFYHQQLRELIEYKANTTSNMSEVTKQYLELQKLRQKMKKKVDTRASKGRRLRYAVHNKLINFMAPNDNSTWTKESIDELSKSLFV